MSEYKTFVTPNPECGNECSFRTSQLYTFEGYYKPTYDKNGNCLNPDKSYVSYIVVCDTCRTKWGVKTNFVDSDIVKFDN